jgi:UPF0271 protein
MQTTVVTALANGVAIGAHPGYPDREGFGRRSGFLGGDESRRSLIEQILALDAIAARNGATLTRCGS